MWDIYNEKQENSWCYVWVRGSFLQVHWGKSVRTSTWCDNVCIHWSPTFKCFLYFAVFTVCSILNKTYSQQKQTSKLHKTIRNKCNRKGMGIYRELIKHPWKALGFWSPIPRCGVSPQHCQAIHRHHQGVLWSNSVLTYLPGHGVRSPGISPTRPPFTP